MSEIIKTKLKQFLQSNDLKDIKNIFIVYNTLHRASPKSAKNYDIDDLKYDCKENYRLIFPDGEDFEERWKLIISRYEILSLDFFECGPREQEFFYKRHSKDKIESFIVYKYKSLNKDERLITLEFLKKTPKKDIDKGGWINNFEKTLKIFNQNLRMSIIREKYRDIRDFFISLGLLLKGEYHTRNNEYKGVEYYYPIYFEDIRWLLSREKKPIILDGDSAKFLG
ncbi:MAG: hypothetical protein ACP6IY_19170 [Promethearchaeia archaeon]